MMARRRIVYLLVTAALFAAFLYLDTYLAAYALLVALVLPVISLAVSLPAMLRCQVRVEGLSGQCPRGQEDYWRITVHNTAGLPMPSVKVRLSLRQTMTGQTMQKTLRYYRISSALEDRLPVDTDHCGIWEASVQWVRVCDAMGLLGLRRRLTVTGRVAVMPQTVEAEPLPRAEQGQGGSVALRPRRGGGMGEEYELREYQPGDPVRMIHWKLSTKREDLILREVLERPEAVPVLTFDHLGPQERLDDVLDRLYALSNALLEQQQAHEIQWLHAESGQCSRFQLRGQQDLHRCFGAILSQPAPAEGHRFPRDLRQTAEWYYYHLEPQGEEAP